MLGAKRLSRVLNRFFFPPLRKTSCPIQSIYGKGIPIDWCRKLRCCVWSPCVTVLCGLHIILKAFFFHFFCFSLDSRWNSTSFASWATGCTLSQNCISKRPRRWASESVRTLRPCPVWLPWLCCIVSQNGTELSVHAERGCCKYFDHACSAFLCVYCLGGYSTPACVHLPVPGPHRGRLHSEVRTATYESLKLCVCCSCQL